MLDRLRWIMRKRDSVIAEWEWYARAHERAGGTRHLGDEWNTPEILGLPAGITDIAQHVDRTVIGPHVGRVGTLLEIGSGGALL